MTKILKMIELLTYIEQSDKPKDISAKKALWAQCHEKTCYILQYVVTGKVYDEIKHQTHTFAA